MCGIFGFSKTTWTQNDIDTFAGLILSRGNQAFGGLSISQDQEIIFRYSKPFVKGTYVPKGDFILCHLLASTGDAKRVHPFETDRFILAHNGILLDYKKWTNSDWHIGPIDSQYILGGIQFNVDNGVNVIDAICVVNGLLQGQRACWMWDRFDKVAYFWRVMSPLYFSNNPFIFSSVEFKDSVMMEEGLIYKYDYQKDLVFTTEKFKFYSPYMV